MATKVKRSTHNEHIPVHDVLDLKDRIKELKTIQEDLQKEREVLLVDIANKEKLFAKLRQELTLLEPSKDLRWQNTDLASESAFSQAEITKYNLLNEKLDMQVLIQELHQALPALELKMKLFESRAQTYSKSLPKNVKTLVQQTNAQLQAKNTSDTESALWKNSNELEELIATVVGEIVERKTEQVKRCVKAQQRSEQLVHDIFPLRQSVELMFQERAMLKKESILGLAKSVHRRKLEYLRTQTKQLRNSLRKYDNGFGWQRELFRHFVANRKDMRTSKPSYKRLDIHENPEEESESHTMRLEEVGQCLRYLVFPRQSLQSDYSRNQVHGNNNNNKHVGHTKSWCDADQVRTLLTEIIFEELLQDERKALHMAALLSGGIKRDDDTNNNASIDMNRDTLQGNERADAKEDDDAMFDEEVEELLVIPSTNSNANANAKANSSGVKVSREQENALRKQAQDQTETMREIDERLFCLLCNRLINTFE